VRAQSTLTVLSRNVHGAHSKKAQSDPAVLGRKLSFFTFADAAHCKH